MFKQLKLVLNEAEPQEREQSPAVTSQPETQASLGTAEHCHRGQEMSPSSQPVLRLRVKVCLQLGNKLRHGRRCKARFLLSVCGGRWGCVWLSSVTAEAPRAKQTAGYQLSSWLHHLHTWLRFEYTNSDTTKQKKTPRLWHSNCSYLYSCA